MKASEVRAQSLIVGSEAGAYGTAEWDEATEVYLKMLAPVAPHIAEELWSSQLGKPYSVHQRSWPKLDEEAAQEDVIEIPVQVNGKVRDRIEVAASLSEDELVETAKASPKVQAHVDGKDVRQAIVVPRKLVNLVVG